YVVTATLPANTTIYDGDLRDQVPSGLRVDSVVYEYNPDVTGTGTWTPVDPAWTTSNSGNLVRLRPPATFAVDATADGLRMTILATVLDQSVNVHERGVTNSGQFRSTNPHGADPANVTSNQTSFRVVEPNPSPVKIVSNDEPRAGEEVTYTLTARNLDPARPGIRRPTLYDVALVDCVPAGLSVDEIG